jgi:hypothetical protein
LHEQAQDARSSKVTESPGAGDTTERADLSAPQRFSDALQVILSRSDYAPRDALSKLEELPNLGYELDQPNSGRHRYSLRAHTLMVCDLYERVAPPGWPFAAAMSKPAFRLTLCVHDLGKSRSLRAGDKSRQHEFTLGILDELGDYLPFREREFGLARALLMDDPVGLFLQRMIELEDAARRIRTMSAAGPAVDIETFMNLLTLYYQMDAGGYTRSAYSVDLNDFAPKPRLEAIFAWTDSGEFIFNETLFRLEFSEPVERRYSQLRAGVV